MIRKTIVKPKELNIFNRDFGNLKQYILEDVSKETCEKYLFGTIAKTLFEYDTEISQKFNTAILNLLDEHYKQQLEDSVQLAVLNNDIIGKNEYNENRRKSIKYSRKEKTTIDIIIEELATEEVVKYLCDEEIKYSKNITDDVENVAIETIILPNSVCKIIEETINKYYPELKERSNAIKSKFVYQVLTIANAIINVDNMTVRILEKGNSCYLDVIKSILNRLDGWKVQLFFYLIRYVIKTSNLNIDKILERYERNFLWEERTEFVKFCEENFLINISFGILFYNAEAITIYYKLEKEEQNAVKNHVVSLSTKIKASLIEELLKFDIRDLEKETVAKEKKELAAKIQLYLLNYKWLELFIRDDQIAKQVEIKEWNMYKNISKTVLAQENEGCFSGNEENVLKKIINVKENYSLDNLCKENFDKVDFWYIVILLREQEISKEQFIDAQKKKGINEKIINLFFTLIEE